MNALLRGKNKIYQNLGNDKFPRFFCCKSKNKVVIFAVSVIFVGQIIKYN